MRIFARFVAVTSVCLAGCAQTAPVSRSDEADDAPFAALTTAPRGPGTRIDISPNFGRKDVLSPDRLNWTPADGPSATTQLNGLTFTLRSVGVAKGTLTGDWYRAGLDYPATMATDGIVAAPGARLELVIHGLPAGKHTLVTYHNAIWAEPTSKYDLSVDGQARVKGVQPSTRVLHDDDAASAFLELTAEQDKDVIIGIQPDGSGKNDRVILNGIEMDTPDPARLVKKVFPAPGDEHVAADPVLTWTPPTGAKQHEVFLGTDEAMVRTAVAGSPEYLGHTASNRIETAFMHLDPAKTYYWRVDERTDAEKPGVAGRVQSFRIRQLAFPGAEGYGRFARGGRGGRVIEVTNLNDSGPGSLREAVDADGPRIVVFRVGGTINLKSKLSISKPYITIAGQTAPGDGICLRGYSFGVLGGHDVIIRYIRIRVGDESGVTQDGSGFGYCDHAIMDHCSISWSIDEGFSSRGGKNITFQRNIIAEALNRSIHSHYLNTEKGHSFAGSISGNVGSFHHNLLVHDAGRNWSLAGAFDKGGKFAGFLDIRNNVVYNWRHRTTDGGVKALNYVGNYYIPGPATTFFALLEPDVGRPGDRQQYHMTGNMMEGKPEFDADNWKAALVDPAMLSEVRSDKPLFDPQMPVQSAKDAYADVIENVGANLPHLDPVDRRVIEDVKNRTFTFTGSKQHLKGIIDSQKDSGGWPEYRGGTPEPDTDHDGMPDAWETQNGLDPRAVADNKLDPDGDGYTNVEEYLNRTDPRKAEVVQP